MPLGKRRRLSSLLPTFHPSLPSFRSLHARRGLRRRTSLWRRSSVRKEQLKSATVSTSLSPYSTLTPSTIPTTTPTTPTAYTIKLVHHDAADDWPGQGLPE